MASSTKKVELFQHQKKAIRRLKGKKSLALLMEPGTGKTLVMIRRMEKLVRLGKIQKILIVAPSAVVPNWVSELKTFWSNEENPIGIVWEGKAKDRNAFPKLIKSQKKTTIVIINYEKVRIDKKLLIKCGFDTLILDESQKVKSRSSQVTQATRLISKKCKYRYLMTGTPMSTGYEDYYSQFLIMNDKIFGTRWKDFEETYCVLGGFQGKQIVGYKNLKQLKRLIKDNSYIVRKRDCLDLPPVIEHKIYCELGSKARKAYKELNEDMITTVEGFNLLNDNFIHTATERELIALDNALVKTMKLQQITGGFLKNTETDVTLMIDNNKMNLLKETIDKHRGESIVIFCVFRAEIDTIRKFYPHALELSGHTKDKGQPVKDFQRGKSNIILVQLKTGSAGINLTKGSVVIFYSWSTSFIDMQQARDRLDRIGQKNTINLYYLIAKDTVDELSLKVLERRKRLSKKII